MVKSPTPEPEQRARIRLPKLFERFQMSSATIFERKKSQHTPRRPASPPSCRSRASRIHVASGPPLQDALPVEVFREIAEFAAGDMSELRNIALLNHTGRALAASIATNENAKVYENEFKKRDPVLHECVALKKDNRSTWKLRLFKIIRFKEDSKSDVVSLDALNVTPRPRRSRRGRTGSSSSSSSSSSSPSSSPEEDPRTRPVLIDVTLYNHPNMGFLVNVGETSRAIVIYGLRDPLPCADGSPKVKSSAQALLGPLQLPIFQTGEPAPSGPSEDNLLMLYSINGRRICDFADFHELINYIKGADDLCRWRMLYFRKFGLDKIPEVCQFRVPSPTAHS